MHEGTKNRKKHFFISPLHFYICLCWNNAVLIIQQYGRSISFWLSQGVSFPKCKFIEPCARNCPVEWTFKQCNCTGREYLLSKNAIWKDQVARLDCFCPRKVAFKQINASISFSAFETSNNQCSSYSMSFSLSRAFLTPLETWDSLIDLQYKSF